MLLPTLCKTSILASDVRNPPRVFPCWTLNFCLYKPCAMCLSLLHFQPCAGSEPDCNCCLSNKYTYMQLRSPEVTRVNFHLSLSVSLSLSLLGTPALRHVAWSIAPGNIQGLLSTPCNHDVQVDRLSWEYVQKAAGTWRLFLPYLLHLINGPMKTA